MRDIYVCVIFLRVKIYWMFFYWSHFFDVHFSYCEVFMCQVLVGLTSRLNLICMKFKTESSNYCTQFGNSRTWFGKCKTNFGNYRTQFWNCIPIFGITKIITNVPKVEMFPAGNISTWTVDNSQPGKFSLRTIIQFSPKGENLPKWELYLVGIFQTGICPECGIYNCTNFRLFKNCHIEVCKCQIEDWNCQI